jgi:SAM-dependent methyltransferase
MMPLHVQYPTQTQKVVVVNPDANESLWQQAGVQAGVSVEVRAQSPEDLSFRPAASFDGIFINNNLSRWTNPDRVLAECYRVLKPGKPIVLVQRVKTGAALQGVAGGSDGMDKARLDGLLGTYAWEMGQYDMCVEGIDGHAIGLYVKAKEGQQPAAAAGSKVSAREEDSVRKRAEGAAAAAAAAKSKQDSKKGFK